MAAHADEVITVDDSSGPDEDDLVLVSEYEPLADTLLPLPEPDHWERVVGKGASSL